MSSFQNDRLSYLDICPDQNIGSVHVVQHNRVQLLRKNNDWRYFRFSFKSNFNLPAISDRSQVPVTGISENSGSSCINSKPSSEHWSLEFKNGKRSPWASSDTRSKFVLNVKDIVCQWCNTNICFVSWFYGIEVTMAQRQLCTTNVVPSRKILFDISAKNTLSYFLCLLFICSF